MRIGLIGLFIALCIMSAVGPVSAWTTPVAVSNTSINASNAKIAKGANGAVHVTYYDANWRVCYRYRNAYGMFGPIETVSNIFSYRSDVIEDAAGNPHVVYPGRVSDQSIDLFEAVKENGIWTTNQLTFSSGVDEDEPKMGLDSNGRIHLIYTRGNDVMYRVWTNGTWSGETWVGTTQNSYYQRPDLSVDPSGNLHVVYGDSTHVYYRKCTTGVWGTVRVIMTAPGFEAFPKIAGTTSNKVVAIAFIQEPSGHLEFTSSSDGGNTWNTQQYLAPGHWPNIDRDDQGNAYVAFTDLGYNSCAAYMKWNGTSWTPSVDVAPTGNWQGWVDIACGTDGIVSMVWDDAASPTRINLSSSAPPADPTPPTSPAPVIDDGSVQIISTYLHARWSASSDPETGIARYEYSIGTAVGSTNIAGWTSVGLTLEVTKTGIFAPGTYYFNVRSVNGAGQYSSVASSDGIQIQSNGNPFAFTSPTTVSASPYSCDNAMLAKASDGGVHLAFQNAMDSGYSNAKVVYRKKNSGTVWGSLEDVTSGSPTGMYPDVVEDATGLIHVIFGNSLGRESMDIFDRVKSGSSWLPAVNLSTNNGMCWYPRVAANSSSVDLVVNAGTTSSNQFVRSAFNTSGTWSSFGDIGASSARYGSPDIVKGPDGTFHAVWYSGSGLVYSKDTGSGWATPTFITSTPSNICMPRIACDNNNRPIVVWLGTNTGAYYEIRFSRWNGSSWTTAEKLGEGHYPVVAVDPGNNVHVAFAAIGANSVEDIIHIVNSGSGWSVARNVSNNTGSSVRPALEIDNSGAVQIAWQDNTGGVNKIMWSYAPAVAASGVVNGYVQTSWNTPIAGAVVELKSGGTVKQTATIGTDGRYTFINVSPGTYDLTANAVGYTGVTNSNVSVSAGATATSNFNLTPLPKTLAEAKGLADGTPVTVSGCIVTAVFDGFFYIEKTDRSMGIRVNSSYVVTPGDAVNISGTMSTVSGERVIVCPTPNISTHGNQVPKALGMNNRSLGGGAVGLQSGVFDGVSEALGTNNIGLLIKTTGKVVEQGTSFIRIDDGSGCYSGSGVAGTKIYTTATPSLGSYVVVTGVSACEMIAGQDKPLSVVRAVKVE